MYNNHAKKAFGCPFCDARFVNQSTLEAHLVFHDANGEHAVNCDLCGKMYGNPTYLRRHVNLVHSKVKVVVQDSTTEIGIAGDPSEEPPKKFQCTVCSKQLASKRSLAHHMENVCCPAPITNFHCQTCSEAFQSRQELTRHMRTTKACSLLSL
jgi:transcription elongation factor Elf1